MKFIQPDPVKIYVDSPTEEEYALLYKKLTYKDKSIDHQIRTLQNNRYYIMSMGEQAFHQRIEELKASQSKQVLFKDKDGIYTLSGLKKELREWFPQAEWEVKFKVAEPALIPFVKPPPFKLRVYQKLSVERLFDVRHGNVELATGAGKTAILLFLAREVALKTVIVAPSTNIATAIYKLFVEHFGKSKVGFFGGSKKETSKLFTVSIAQSLTRVESGSDAWNELSKVDCFMFDECHLVAAETFFKVATGIAAGATHRYFCSATPERNDGKDLLLKGIIGDTVCRKTIKDLIDEGYLAKISTTIVDVESDDTYMSKNALKMNQHHLYENKKILKFICDTTNAAYVNGIPTLILVDEHDQEKLLKAYMRNPYDYASSHSDTNKIIDDFNAGKSSCVVGTSAVSVGSDFKSNRLTFDWQGGKAGTKVKQGPIGRSTRIDDRTGKKECRIISFRVVNVPMLKRHANIKISHYEEVGPVSYVRL